MKRIKKSILILGASLLLFSSCYDIGSVYYDELDVTLTQYDVEHDFSSYNTFAMPDSTVLKTNYLTDEEIEEFYKPGGSAEKSRAALKENMEASGYTYQEDIETASFVAVPTLLMVKTSGAVYYPPGWWWGYPGYGWGYPGYGWGYPGYPWYPSVSYYSYKTGTLIYEIVDGESFSDMLDWLDANPGEKDPNDFPDLLIRWTATIDGYVSSNGDYNAQRAARGTEEAFDQSPYLKK